MDRGERLEVGSRVGGCEIIAWTGSAYRARDPDLGQDVVIRPLPAEVSLGRGFQREVHRLTSFTHPNVGAIYDVVIHHDRPYWITELLEGETLAARLGRGALSVEETVAVAAQLADGLDALHEGGIVHGELTSDNVVLGEDGNARIVIVGRVAPATESGQAADVRAFGALVQEMLTGERELHRSRLPPSTPEALRRLIASCLEAASGQRLRDLGDLRIALSRSADVPAPTARRRWPLARVARWVFVAFAVVLIVTAYVTLRR
jgi:serine/threonine protein kinase